MALSLAKPEYVPRALLAPRARSPDLTLPKSPSPAPLSVLLLLLLTLQLSKCCDLRGVSEDAGIAAPFSGHPLSLSRV